MARSFTMKNVLDKGKGIDDYDDVNAHDEDQLVKMRKEGAFEGEELDSAKLNSGKDRFSHSLEFEKGYGENIEAFNMTSDKELGYFDENENFVFRRQSKDEEDNWLSGLDESSILLNKPLSSSYYNSKGGAAGANAYDDDTEGMSVLNLLSELYSCMEGEETVKAALRRLSGLSSSAKSGLEKRGGNSFSKSSNGSKGGSNLEHSASNKDKFNRVTDITNALLGEGLSNPFNFKRETIFNMISLWEYRDVSSGTIQGPFTTHMILNWMSAGYFKGNSSVWMRTIGPITPCTEKLNKKGKDSNSNNSLSNNYNIAGGALRLFRDQLRGSQRRLPETISGSKRVASSLPSVDVKKAKSSDSIYSDSDSDDLDGLGKDETTAPQPQPSVGSSTAEDISPPSENISPPSILTMPRGQWVMSDGIDFGTLGDISLMERLDSRPHLSLLTGRTADDSRAAAAPSYGGGNSDDSDDSGNR